MCVREPYQGQGYMRKVMEMAFAEGDRLQISVILDTDAKSKRDKYVRLGMEPAGGTQLRRLWNAVRSDSLSESAQRAGK